MASFFRRSNYAGKNQFKMTAAITLDMFAMDILNIGYCRLSNTYLNQRTVSHANKRLSVHCWHTLTFWNSRWRPSCHAGFSQTWLSYDQFVTFCYLSTIAVLNLVQIRPNSAPKPNSKWRLFKNAAVFQLFLSTLYKISCQYLNPRLTQNNIWS